MHDSKLIVVTPAKNEAAYIPTTISSMLKQSVLPAEWIIVDDGSTDGTDRIAQHVADSHAWVTCIQKGDSSERRVGLATVHAIRLALAKTRQKAFEYICVIDADVDLPEDYFASILREFERQPTLGIAAGQIYEADRSGKLVPMRGAPEATAGAIKCWRRQCFENIGGPIDEPGWDGVDQYQAARHGWLTRTFDGESFRVIHLRPVGSSHKGVLNGRMRRGRSGYFMGSHPAWILTSALFHISDRPFLLGSLFVLLGYFGALWRSEPKIKDDELIAFVRRKQLTTLRSKFFSPLLQLFSNTKDSHSWQQQ